jgi:type VI protein secretion system component VasK
LKGFCIAFDRAMKSKYPFDPSSKDDARLEDLDGLLLPKSGTLWESYRSGLKSVLQCSNNECTATGAKKLDPKFAPFIGNLMKLSQALYGDAGTAANYYYSLRPRESDQVEQLDVAINGDEQQLKGGTQHAYTWPGAGTRGFKLSLKLARGTDMRVQNWDGLWAVFRFFADADRTTPSGSAYTFGWGFRQGRGAQMPEILRRPLTYEFSVEAGGSPVVFTKEFLAGLKCVVPVSR